MQQVDAEPLGPALFSTRDCNPPQRSVRNVLEIDSPGRCAEWEDQGVGRTVRVDRADRLARRHHHTTAQQLLCDAPDGWVRRQHLHQPRFISHPNARPETRTVCAGLQPGIIPGIDHPRDILASWTLIPGTPIPGHPRDIPRPRGLSLGPVHPWGVGWPDLRMWCSWRDPRKFWQKS